MSYGLKPMQAAIEYLFGKDISVATTQPNGYAKSMIFVMLSLLFLGKSMNTIRAMQFKNVVESLGA